MAKKIFVMLTKTPFGNDEDKVRLAHTVKDDVVVFAQDSILGFSNPESQISKLAKEKLAEGVRIFASQPDCIARGVMPIEGIKMVGYPEQIDLICECELSY
jgi:sulfur relay protein TusB/DsrH